MLNSITIRALHAEELPRVQELLRAASLPADDIDRHAANILVALSGVTIIGAVAFENHGADGFIPSFVVDAEFRNSKIGSKLYEAIMERMKQSGITRVGLMTDTAERYFAKQEFAAVKREECPEFIRNTTEFRIYCASSSTIMIKNL